MINVENLKKIISWLWSNIKVPGYQRFIENRFKMQEKENKSLKTLSHISVQAHYLFIEKHSRIHQKERTNSQKAFSHISVQAHYRFIEKRVNYWLRGKNYWLPLIDLGKKWRCPRNRGAAVIDVKQFPDKERICLLWTYFQFFRTISYFILSWSPVKGCLCNKYPLNWWEMCNRRHSNCQEHPAVNQYQRKLKSTFKPNKQQN